MALYLFHPFSTATSLSRSTSVKSPQHLSALSNLFLALAIDSDLSGSPPLAPTPLVALLPQAITLCLGADFFTYSIPLLPLDLTPS